MNVQNNLYEKIFLYSVNLSFILYFLALLGVGSYVPIYLENLKSLLKIYVGVLLFVRYNPITYKDKKFSEFDRQLVFSSSLLLLLSTALISGIENNLKNNIQKLL